MNKTALAKALIAIAALGVLSGLVLLKVIPVEQATTDGTILTGILMAGLAALGIRDQVPAKQTVTTEVDGSLVQTSGPAPAPGFVAPAEPTAGDAKVTPITKPTTLPTIPPSAAGILVFIAALVLGPHVSGCTSAEMQKLEAAFPQDKISAYATDGGLIVDSVKVFVDGYFAAHPNPELQAKVDAVMAKCKLGLDAGIRILAGVKDATSAQIASAFGEFTQAYSDLMALVQPLGVKEKTSAPKTPTMKAEAPGLTIDRPLVLGVSH